MKIDYEEWISIENNINRQLKDHLTPSNPTEMEECALFSEEGKTACRNKKNTIGYLRRLILGH